MEGRPDRRNKPAFTNSSDIVWMEPNGQFRVRRCNLEIRVGMSGNGA